MIQKKHILLASILALGIILWWLTTNRHQKSEVPAVRPLSKAESKQPILPKAISSTNNYPPGSIVPFIKQDPEWQWKRPISFYGKVVDENNQPVSGAEAEFGWNDLSASDGHSEYKTMSDANGLFSLTGVQGKRLLVSVKKDGYYTSQEQNQKSYEYADPGEDIYYKPDPNQPVLFHLQKKIEAEPLICYQEGFKVPKDGTPVEVDLLKGQIVPTGQGHFKIECWTKPQRINEKGLYENQFSWKCRVTIPNGGLTESLKEFDVIAPESGYRPTLEIEMPKGAKDWNSDFSKKLFIKAANGKIYARGVFKMIAEGDHFFRLELFVNPAGSRNLEYDPAKEIKAK